MSELALRDRGLRLVAREHTIYKDGVDHDTLVAMLARVADRRGLSVARALEALQACGSRDEQMKLARELLDKGMTPTEKRDLVALLSSEVSMTAGARSFLESVVHGRPLQPLGHNLDVTRHRSHIIAGRAPDGTRIHVTPMSRWVGKPFDTFETTKTAHNGAFDYYDASMRAGDVYRLDYRLPSAANWRSEVLRARGRRNARAPEVDSEQIALLTDPRQPGAVVLSDRDPSRVVAVPLTELRVTNERTGETRKVIVDAHGRFAPVRLPAVPGDRISVRAFDGARFSKRGQFVVGPHAGGIGFVDLPDPDPIDNHAGLNKRRFRGPLFEPGPLHAVPLQGRIGDCYLACGLALLGAYYPERLADNIKKLDNGNYEVTLWTGRTARLPVKVEVDSELYTDGRGTPIYMRSRDGSLWPMIAEKAIATYAGGYEGINQGGKALDVVKLLAAVPYFYMGTLNDADPDEVLGLIADAVEDGRAACAGTFDTPEYTYPPSSGLVGPHNYAIIGVDKTQRRVQMRNPWGRFEPGTDAKNDGIFWYPIDALVANFKTFSVVTAGRRLSPPKRPHQS